MCSLKSRWVVIVVVKKLTLTRYLETHDAASLGKIQAKRAHGKTRRTIVTTTALTVLDFYHRRRLGSRIPDESARIFARRAHVFGGAFNDAERRKRPARHDGSIRTERLQYPFSHTPGVVPSQDDANDRSIRPRASGSRESGRKATRRRSTSRVRIPGAPLPVRRARRP